MEFKQINIKHDIEYGDEPKGPSPTRIKEIIYNSLNNNNYKFNWIDNTKQPYEGELFIKGNKINLYIYVWRITNGGKGRNMPFEKRIQINQNVNNVGFNRIITEKEKTILLGIYENKPLVPIFAAWDAKSNRNHTQKSCQVNIVELKKALDEGICQTQDKKNNIIYTFTEDYLGEYIELVQDSGFVKIDTTIDNTKTLKEKVKGSTINGKIKSENIDIEELLKKVSGLGEKVRETVVKARVGQGIFKKLLINKYKGKCCICGLECENLLIGSHIKDWAKSNDDEKLDVNNGLLLCSKHDALFDKYFISFDKNGGIIISDKLSESDKEILGLSNDIKIELNDEMKPYLDWHRNLLK